MSAATNTQDGLKISSDRSTAVDPTYFWRPINADTPRGVKLQLINRHAGVAVYGIHTSGKSDWTHWAPLPKFKD